MARQHPRSVPVEAVRAAPEAAVAATAACRTVTEVHFRYHVEVPGVGWVRRLVRGEETGNFPGNTVQRVPPMLRDATTGEIVVGAYRLGLSSPHLAAYRLEGD